MKYGSGCKACAIYPNCTAEYRGSECAALRSEFGLGDPMTNADHIRSMSDEELADFLARFGVACVNRACPNQYELDGNFVSVATDWLKQPYGGADH